MKKIITLLALVLVQQSFAIGFYEQLCAFNPNWKKYAGLVAKEEARFFPSDKEYIQAHLGQVLMVLQQNEVDFLTVTQYQSRIKLIGILSEYREAGKFPLNYYRKERIPVFIDEHQTHCAVGYLMQQTGNEALARRISATDNYIWVKDIKDAEALVWQKQSGFTLEELKLIQGAYDFYMPRALENPFKYEIPQKPECITTYFEKVSAVLGIPRKTKHIWLRGEGKNGVLHGKWEQNFAIGIPWIIGYFDHGKRTGQWMEYYQGTNDLCRTEVWKDDKLNGIRKRFDREGTLIEEIEFKDGVAISKTNYDNRQKLTWVRKPIDSTLVATEVFNAQGKLIAKGMESVFNPGNLLWFQNIELTALNSAAITSRQLQTTSYSRGQRGSGSVVGARGFDLFQTPPLVEYKKEGEWMYYKDCDTSKNLVQRPQDFLVRNYRHFGNELNRMNYAVKDWKTTGVYDSIKLVYTNNLVRDFYGYGLLDFAHLHFRYYTKEEIYGPYGLDINLRGNYNEQYLPLKLAGQYNRDHAKIGTWSYFNKYSSLIKTENFLEPEPDPITVADVKSLTKSKQIPGTATMYRWVERKAW